MNELAAAAIGTGISVGPFAAVYGGRAIGVSLNRRRRARANARAAIVDALRRSWCPASVDAIARATGLSPERANLAVRQLLRAGTVTHAGADPEMPAIRYYRLAGPGQEDRWRVDAAAWNELMSRTR